MLTVWKKANQHFLWNAEIANGSRILPLRKECGYCPKQQNPCSQEEDQLGVETQTAFFLLVKLGCQVKPDHKAKTSCDNQTSNNQIDQGIRLKSH